MKPTYERAGVSLYLGDCFDVMREMETKSIDVVITDPPYGIRQDKGKSIARKQYDGDWDAKRPEKIYFDEILRVSKTAIIWGGNYFADLLPAGNHWLVWDKLNTMPTFGDCELAWTNVKRNSVKKYTKEYNGLLGKEGARVHPTQKSLSVMLYCTENYTHAYETVFDPYMGSGTTGVAALQLGRRFVGIEKDPTYFEMAVKRIETTLKQPALFQLPSRNGNQQQKMEMGL